MTYISIDDTLPDERAVLPLTDRAFRLHVTATCYAGRSRTDGVVPAAAAGRWVSATPKQVTAAVAELVAVNLWHTTGHTCESCPPCGAEEYVVHGYLVLNRSRSDIEDLAAKRSAAGRKGGSKSKPRTSKAEASASANDDQSANNPQAKPTPDTDTDTERTTAAAVVPAAAAATPVENPAATSGLPAAVEILKSKLDHAGLVVRWDKLKPEQQDQIEALVDEHGDAKLVAAALSHRAGHSIPASYAQAWLGLWSTLPPPGRTLAAVPEPRCTQPGHEHQAARSCSACRIEAKVVGGPRVYAHLLPSSTPPGDHR